jgi:prepilin-type processing-associated H-X9-DG protein
MTRRNRLAFTVVELLVVIAIIGTLVALLLPAVNYARRVMQKMSCATNMRQFGVAEIAYEQAVKTMSASRGFPVNANISRPNTVDLSASASNPNVQSWVMPLLPYIERNDLFDQIETVPSGGSLPNFDGQRIPLVWCPSDISDNSAANRSSYVVNGGRFNASSSNGPPLDHQANGCFDDRMKGRTDSFQIFQGARGMTMAELVRGDGSSNTLMLLENADVLGWNKADNERDVAVVWSPTNETHALNLYDASNPTKRRRFEAEDPFSNRHARPSSFHANGFNVVFCDGTTKFIADSIDYMIYCQLMTSNSKQGQLKEPGTNTASMIVLPLLSSGSY